MISALPIEHNFSGRLVRKGILLEETYRIFAHFHLDEGLRENIARVREENLIGARNQAWLREVTTTVSSRFSQGESIDGLVTLAAGGLSLEIWKFCLLWHIGTTDGLYRDFISEFLFPQVGNGVAMFTTDDVIPFVCELGKRGVFQEELSEYGVRRLARDLLRMAGDFGFVKGSARREVVHQAIPENAILYAIYSLWQDTPSADRLIKSDRWKLFMMNPAQVEHELLNFHQFHRLRFERAGTVREMSLPHGSLLEFSKSIIA